MRPFTATGIGQALETQQANGHIKPIAPSNGWGQTYGPDNKPGQCSDPWWGGVVGLLNWDYYNIYGDRRLLEEGYLALKRWVRYLSSTAKDDMLDWQLGDWCEVGKVHGSAQRSPLVQTATAGYYMAVNSLARAAKLLGHEEDAVTYDRLARQIKGQLQRGIPGSAFWSLRGGQSDVAGTAVRPGHGAAQRAPLGAGETAGEH